MFGVSYTTVAFLLFVLYPATSSLKSGLQNPARQKINICFNLIAGKWIQFSGSTRGTVHLDCANVIFFSCVFVIFNQSYPNPPFLRISLPLSFAFPHSSQVLWVVNMGRNGKNSRVEVPSGRRLARRKVWFRGWEQRRELRLRSPGGRREVVSRWLIPMMRMDWMERGRGWMPFAFPA